MIKLREAILVEGRYDVNTVRQVVDTVVLETGGFRIFNNKEQLKVIRRIAETRGLIVLTDSDGAGFVIRNYLKGSLPQGRIKQAYVPDISGKERRKKKGGKEGNSAWRECARRSFSKRFAAQARHLREKRTPLRPKSQSPRQISSNGVCPAAPTAPQDAQRYSKHSTCPRI